MKESEKKKECKEQVSDACEKYLVNKNVALLCNSIREKDVHIPVCIVILTAFVIIDKKYLAPL